MISQKTSFADCLVSQARPHPAMEPRDAAKLCCQAAFGGEHLPAWGTAEEKPTYRVTSGEFLPLLPILERMAAARGSFVVAIDGRAASGKSTAAGLLSLVTGAGVIHMDDFFLPAQLRTAQRLHEAGGNVHYERFAREVLPRLRSSSGFSYRRFDCGLMAPGPQVEVAASPYRVVEGAYAHHPALGSYMDLRVFFHVEPEEQLRRIRLRDGEEGARRFRELWIPLEEQYFSVCSIPGKADVTVEA